MTGQNFRLHLEYKRNQIGDGKSADTRTSGFVVWKSREKHINKLENGAVVARIISKRVCTKSVHQRCHFASCLS